MGFAERIFKRSPAPKATEPVAPGPQATAENLGDTPDEVAFFKSGEVVAHANAAEAERQAQVAAYNAREAKIRAAEGLKKEEKAA